MTVRDFKELIVWQKAMDLVVAVYKATANFPREELYGLSSQLRKSAISVPSNIAEGQGRRTTKDFINFLSIADGSLCEVKTQLMIAERLGYLRESAGVSLFQATEEVHRLLHGLINSLETKLSTTIYH
jgi:four helix bundle protein